MANATKRGTVATIPYGDFASKYGAVSTAQSFFPNAQVALNGGYADKSDDTASKQWLGVYPEVNTQILAGGNNGDVLLDVNQPRFIKVTTSTAITVANLNQLVYALDDQTVQLTPGNFANPVGRIHALGFDGDNGASGTVAVVEVFYGSIEERRGWVASAATLTATGNAIPIKEGTVFVTDAAAAAMTLALPTAGADDFKQLAIVSTTAYAHTVTTPANGLNGNKHVATCAGAAGNCLLLQAYQGVWYVLPTSGITLS